MGVSYIRNAPVTPLPRKCTACNGSGHYDAVTKKGRPIPCGPCGGTGEEARGA